MIDGTREVKAADGKQRRLWKIATEPDGKYRSLVQVVGDQGALTQPE